MRNELKLILVLIYFSFNFESLAQDMQFTQFNAAPLYLNPGFTGTTIQHRIATSYRNQWPAIPGHFVNYVFSYDYNVDDLNSGIGFLMARESAGTGKLGSTELAFLYSYHFKFSNKLFIQPGLKLNHISRGVKLNKLVFNDQLTTGSSSTSEAFQIDKTKYFDVSSGVIVYGAKYWAGMAFNHMNEPNQSIINKESALPMKFSAHGGYKIKLADDGNNTSKAKFVDLTFQYKSQKKFDQLDLGIYYTQDPLFFGLWYRGLPLIKSYEGVLNNDALAFLVGYSIEEYNLSIGYSYDVTISRLSSNTAGSHEISLIYEAASKRKKKKKKRFFVPCPKF